MKSAPEFTDSIVIKLGSGLGVATWFRLRLPYCSPGSNPMHTIYSFSIYIVKTETVFLRKRQK